jgi:hypothetical protein
LSQTDGEMRSLSVCGQQYTWVRVYESTILFAAVCD